MSQSARLIAKRLANAKQRAAEGSSKSTRTAAGGRFTNQEDQPNRGSFMDELWAGVELKLQHAEFHFDMMGRSVQQPERTAINVASGALADTDWHRAFAYFDAFLSTARSVPEIIQCCFGVDLGHTEMKEWFRKLPADEQGRRHEFKKKFKRQYGGFRELPLSKARNIIEHRGVPPVTATISRRFGVTQIDDPNLAFLAKAHPLRPKWEDFYIEGRPLFPACQEDYLNLARTLVDEARSIALLVHDTKSLSSPPNYIDWP
jgi:hypothetical protein